MKSVLKLIICCFLLSLSLLNAAEQEALELQKQDFEQNSFSRKVLGVHRPERGLDIPVKQDWVEALGTHRQLQFEATRLFRALWEAQGLKGYWSQKEATKKEEIEERKLLVSSDISQTLKDISFLIDNGLRLGSPFAVVMADFLNSLDSTDPNRTEIAFNKLHKLGMNGNSVASTVYIQRRWPLLQDCQTGAVKLEKELYEGIKIHAVNGSQKAQEFLTTMWFNACIHMNWKVGEINLIGQTAKAEETLPPERRKIWTSARDRLAELYYSLLPQAGHDDIPCQLILWEEIIKLIPFSPVARDKFLFEFTKKEIAPGLRKALENAKFDDFGDDIYKRLEKLEQVYNYPEIVKYKALQLYLRAQDPGQLGTFNSLKSNLALSTQQAKDLKQEEYELQKSVILLKQQELLGEIDKEKQKILLIKKECRQKIEELAQGKNGTLAWDIILKAMEMYTLDFGQMPQETYHKYMLDLILDKKVKQAKKLFVEALENTIKARQSETHSFLLINYTKLLSDNPQQTLSTTAQLEQQRQYELLSKQSQLQWVINLGLATLDEEILWSKLLSYALDSQLKSHSAITFFRSEHFDKYLSRIADERLVSKSLSEIGALSAEEVKKRFINLLSLKKLDDPANAWAKLFYYTLRINEIWTETFD